MPMRSRSACSVPGCPELAVRAGRCDRHARFYQSRRARQYDSSRGTASQRGYGSDWQKQRAAFLAENPYCVSCGAPATVVDHVIRRRAGGQDEPSNYQAMCARCHGVKSLQDVHRS